MTNELVYFVRLGKGTGRSSPQPPAHTEMCSQASLVGTLGRTTTPGVECAKEHDLTSVAPPSQRRCMCGDNAIHIHVSITTLGNGYLGSHINEECSEM